MKYNLGIIGPGKIAGVVAKALVNIPEINLYAVASRSYERAEMFAETYGFQKAFGSYEEMVKTDNIDLVYIATPHSFHFEHMLLCLNYGKNIICEKAFCLNENEARKVIDLAHQKKVFVTEALCTAYLPSKAIIQSLLQKIGKVVKFEGVFGAPLMDVERVAKKELGGGALLDLGVYPLYFVLSTLGNDFKITDVAMKMVNEVDEECTINLLYQNNINVIIEISVGRDLGYYCDIFGTKGRIHIDNFGMPSAIEIFDENNQLLKTITDLYPCNGYEYEFLAAINAIKNKQIETNEMPHQDTLELMALIDKIRLFQ